MTSRCPSREQVPEGVRRAAGVLEGRWTVSILYASYAGCTRFNEFKQAVGEIPPRTLALRLTELERKEREQPPPACQDRGRGQHSDHDLIEPRGARIDDVEVAIRVCEPVSASLHFGKYYTYATGAWLKPGTCLMPCASFAHISPDGRDISRLYARAQAARASTTARSLSPSPVRTYSTSGGRASRTSRRRTPAFSSSTRRCASVPGGIVPSAWRNSPKRVQP